MGANAQTTVPTFTASQVLTAAQMNESARTGVPVFADATARDAGFGGTGEKTLAEGQLAYLEDLNVVQYYDGAAWATVGPSTPGGLVRIGGGTLSTGTTAFSNVFSSTYDAYKIVITNGATSGSSYIKMILGATVTGYFSAPNGATQTGTQGTTFNGSETTFWPIGYSATTDFGLELTIFNPNLAKRTQIEGGLFRLSSEMAQVVGTLDNTTQYTGFTLSTSTGTFSGTVNIYGYSLS